MSSIAEFRKKFAQKIINVESRLTNERAEMKRRISRMQESVVSRNPSGDFQADTVEGVAFPSAIIEKHKLHAKNVEEKNRILDEKLKRFEENYEQEIDRLQKELTEVLMREVELGATVKNLKEHLNKSLEEKALSDSKVGEVGLVKRDFELVKKDLENARAGEKKAEDLLSDVEKKMKQGNGLDGIIARLEKEVETAKASEKKMRDSLDGSGNKVKRENELNRTISELKKRLEDSQSAERNVKFALTNVESRLKAAQDEKKTAKGADGTGEVMDKLKEANHKLELMKKQLEEKDKLVKDMTKSTSTFLDSALKQEQSRIAGLADKTVNVVYQKKEFEMKYNTMKEEHEALKNKLKEKDKSFKELKELSDRNIELKKTAEENKSAPSEKTAELETVNAELKERIKGLESLLQEEVARKSADDTGPQKAKARPVSDIDETKIMEMPVDKLKFSEDIRKKTADKNGDTGKEAFSDDKNLYSPVSDGDQTKIQDITDGWAKSAESGGKEVENYGSGTAQESLSVINKFIGWLGKPMINIDTVNGEKEPKTEDKDAGSGEKGSSGGSEGTSGESDKDKKNK